MSSSRSRTTSGATVTSTTRAASSASGPSTRRRRIGRRRAAATNSSESRTRPPDDAYRGGNQCGIVLGAGPVWQGERVFEASARLIATSGRQLDELPGGCSDAMQKLRTADKLQGSIFVDVDGGKIWQSIPGSSE